MDSSEEAYSIDNKREVFESEEKVKVMAEILMRQADVVGNKVQESRLSSLIHLKQELLES